LKLFLHTSATRPSVLATCHIFSCYDDYSVYTGIWNVGIVCLNIMTMTMISNLERYYHRQITIHASEYKHFITHPTQNILQCRNVSILSNSHHVLFELDIFSARAPGVGFSLENGMDDGVLAR
jgi:hypothetical protein